MLIRKACSSGIFSRLFADQQEKSGLADEHYKTVGRFNGIHKIQATNNKCKRLVKIAIKIIYKKIVALNETTNCIINIL